MNHDQIEKDEIVERYLLRKLSPDEEKLFEEHFFGCDHCFIAVKETEKAIFGIKDAAQRGVLVSPRAEKKAAVDLLDWLKSFALKPAFVAAAAVLVLVLVYPAWRGVVTVSRLENEIETLRRPQANAPGYYLEQTRASGKIEGIEIPVKSEVSFVLNFNLPKSDISAPQYRAEILDQNEKVIWQAQDLKSAGDYAIYSIVCRSSFFREGLYTLKVDEINSANGQIVEQFSFPFEIVFGEANVRK